MHVNLNVPKAIEDALRREMGEDLELATRDALALEAYRRGKLSFGQFAEMLNLTTDEADEFLKQRGVHLDVSLAEIRNDVDSLRESLGK